MKADDNDALTFDQPNPQISIVPGLRREDPDQAPLWSSRSFGSEEIPVDQIEKLSAYIGCVPAQVPGSVESICSNLYATRRYCSANTTKKGHGIGFFGAHEPIICAYCVQIKLTCRDLWLHDGDTLGERLCHKSAFTHHSPQAMFAPVSSTLYADAYI